MEACAPVVVEERRAYLPCAYRGRELLRRAPPRSPFTCDLITFTKAATLLSISFLKDVPESRFCAMAWDITVYETERNSQLFIALYWAIVTTVFFRYSMSPK
jgi:hypothetical protein